MAGPMNKRPVAVVHLLDRARSRSRKFNMDPTVCGLMAPYKSVTTHGWKVTCEVCNPPTRRKVRIKPRPGSPAIPKKDLEKV